jgi:hypothetical protein
VVGFLKTYGLDGHFKINIEPNHTTLAGHAPEHDILIAAQYGMLGSIDANTGKWVRTPPAVRWGGAVLQWWLCWTSTVCINKNKKKNERHNRPTLHVPSLPTQSPARAGNPSLGWDTDNFLMNPQTAALIMKAVLEQGGIAPGGLNFDAKVRGVMKQMEWSGMARKQWLGDGGARLFFFVGMYVYICSSPSSSSSSSSSSPSSHPHQVRRESTDLEDLFIAHIGGMDCYARGLLAAAKMLEEGTLPGMVKARYSSFDSGLGKVSQSPR